MAFCRQIKSHVKSVADQPRQCPISPTGIVSCQALRAFNSGNAELPSDPCWRDPRLECTNRLRCRYCPARQGDFSDFHPASSGNVISWGQPFCDSRLRRFCRHTKSAPASALHLLPMFPLKAKIKFLIIQIFDGLMQIVGQDVPARNITGFHLCRAGGFGDAPEASRAL